MSLITNEPARLVAPLEGALAAGRRLAESPLEGAAGGFWSEGRATSLFLAYLAAETADAGTKRLAEEIALAARRPRTTIEAAGAIYVGAHLGGLWNREDWIDRAEQLLPRIAEGIDRDRALDCTSGLARAIPALLALHAVRSESLAGALALRCGDRLLELAEPADRGLWWPDLPAATGFFHGPSGIAWVLTKLGFPRFTDGALAAMARERQVPTPDIATARELALSRLAMFREMPDLLFLHDARLALLDADGAATDDFVSALELARAATEAWPADVRWALRRHECLSGLLDEINAGDWEALERMPGGVAGAGLSLLRAVASRRVPSAVLLEAPGY